MSAPLAKGIVITISILLAAGIAVYESPQIQEWLETSSKRITEAWNEWGNEPPPRRPSRPNSSPRSNRSNGGEDISMTEELGEAAELRRQAVREDLRRRRELIEAHKTNTNHPRPTSTFDKLVDYEGHLKSPTKKNESEPASKSSAVDLSDPATINRLIKRPSEFFPTLSKSSSQVRHGQDQDPLESRSRLIIPPASEVSSNHPSESLVDLTPTSEFPESELAFSVISSSHTPQGSEAQEPSSPVAPSSTEDSFHSVRQDRLHENQTSSSHTPSVDFEQNVWTYNRSTAPSIASSVEYIQGEPFENISDVTLSEVDDRDNTYTPASWSEVGSVISSDDGGAH